MALVHDVDGVLLDAGGVLVLPDPAVLGPLLAVYGADATWDAHARAHYAGMAVKSQQGAEERDWKAYDLAYVRSLGVPMEDEDEAAVVLGRTRSAWLWRAPIHSSIDALGAFYDQRIPTGVVSNASGQIEHVLRRSAVCQVGSGPGVPVRCVVDSHVVGVAKPDPEIFAIGLRALGLPPERVVYVGDSVTMDVGGATAAGLLPVLLDPYDDHPGARFDRIRSLEDLLD
jgi:putative hydrolase of the HAD superfamily